MPRFEVAPGVPIELQYLDQKLSLLLEGVMAWTPPKALIAELICGLIFHPTCWPPLHARCRDLYFPLARHPVRADDSIACFEDQIKWRKLILTGNLKGQRPQVRDCRPASPSSAPTSP